jgi:hypothetical protein
MSTPNSAEPELVISQKLFLLVMGGALVFLAGVVAVMTFMPQG